MEAQRLMIPKWTHQVKVFNDAIKSLDAIKVLADNFDGKVINKRFITKLNEISDRNIIIFSLEEKGYSQRVRWAWNRSDWQCCRLHLPQLDC